MKQRLLIIALILGPLAWWFGGALASDEMFAFRDAAHYYYPYYQYVAERWADGVPLWNAQSNLGQPLLADATAAVLYPGKLIFALPLDYGTNYKLYVIGHVLFAAVAAFIAARGFAASNFGATICALSYAFSGSVLFQHCNVIFLVGAAWLPLAMLAMHRMLCLRSYRWATALAAVLAMMIFGGDPQLAYHVMLIAVLYAVVQRRKDDRLPRWSSVDGRRSASSILRSRFALLITAGLFAFTLAAVQILPSAQWSRGSTRAVYDSPRNIYEWVASDGKEADRDDDNFLLGQLRDGHPMESYHYSVGPWQAASFLWPNCFGEVFPTNTRWIRALPAEDRTWTPTLYMGILPLLLALSQFRWRRKAETAQPTDAIRRWLTYTVIFAALAALGWYSFGWIYGEIYHAIGGADARPLPIGWPFGGLYWLMQSVLPGYVYFRYPAKWLVVVAMGLSLLAAGGWDQLVARGSRFVTRGLLGVSMVSAVLLLVGALLINGTDVWQSLAGTTYPDADFGPLDLDLAGRKLLFSLSQTTIVAGALWWLARRMNNAVRWSTVAVMIIVAIDLTVAQRGLLPTAQNTNPVAGVDRGEFPQRAYRLFAPPPNDWAETSSPNRLTEIVQRDQQTLLPKYQLTTDLEIINAGGSLQNLAHDRFIREIARRRVLSWAGVQTVLIHDQQPRPLKNTASRVAITHDVVILPALEYQSTREVARRTVEVLDAIQNGPPNLAVVETDRMFSPLSMIAQSDEADEHCEIVSYTSQQVRLRAVLHADGLLILRDSYAPGWTCEVRNHATGSVTTQPILRTNRVMRGVLLPAGEYDITFAYRPAAFRWGAAISIFGWGVLLVFGGIAAWQRFGPSRNASGCE